MVYYWRWRALKCLNNVLYLANIISNDTINVMKRNIRAVSETNIGLYVWRLPDGSYLHDGDMNFLSIPARRGDLIAISNITKVAKNLGFEGEPEFAEGYRKVSDEEFEEQLFRLLNGLTPDPLDIGVYKDGLSK